MRQVFASPRLENVEGIARFLEEHGVEVRITEGRSYKGGWSGRRSYRDADNGPQPAVWVVRSEDQPRARQLLREAGLLGTTRQAADSFLAPSVHAAAPAAATPDPQRRAFRYKAALLLAIAVAAALAFSVMRRHPSTPAGAPEAASVAPAAPGGDAAPGVYRVDTPPALAATLASAELDAHGVDHACLAIDGQPAADAVVAGLQRPGVRVTSCAPPGDAPLAIEVGNYRTDGSGTGTVELAISSRDASGRAGTQIRTLRVRRVEADWHVLQVLSVR